MRIGIDARFVGPEGTGLGKYSEKLILYLAKIDKDNEYIIFLKKTNWDYLKLTKNFKKVLADVAWYSQEEQIKLPSIFLNQKLDLLHIPHFNAPLFYKGKFIVTIHDLIHHQFSQESVTTRNPLIYKFKRAAYKYVINSAVKKAQKIIVPSNFVKNEIANYFKVDSSKIVVTYEAAEEEYFDSQKSFAVCQLLKKYSLRKPFLIYVGNAYPHKNLERLLDAFKILTINYQPSRQRRGSPLAATINLSIVCSRDIFWQRLKKKVKELGLEERVIMTGYIDSKYLSIIFREAQTYIFPSLSEGFGIPGLNAMASGLPLVCSNILTLKEVYGNAALYFDPDNPKDIADKIAKVLTDINLRSRLIKEGKSQVKKYSWLKMAKETLDVYKQVS